MTFRVHILGCGSATPTLRHAPSAQLVEHDACSYLIDCGEGTQLQLRRSKVSFQHMQAVFISHLHGDHCLGLIPLLSSLALLGRTKILHLYAPAEYEQLYRAEMACYCPQPGYDIVLHAMDTTAQKVIYEDRRISVTTLPLQHRVPCCGFLFREKGQLPHIRRDMIDALRIPISQINNIKNGAGWTDADGHFYTHEQLTLPARKPRAYAYCSDTAYMPTLHEAIAGVDLLYHEATYADDNSFNALRYHHSTARQAAQVARQANAARLIIGHYSSRYSDENLLLNEAKDIFPDTLLANEGLVIDV